MRNDIIIYFIELIVINMYVYYSFKKILNIETKSIKRLLTIFFSSIILSVIGTYIEFFVNAFLNLIIVIFFNGLILGRLTKNKIGYSLIISLIAYAVCMLCHGISVIIGFIPYSLTNIDNKYLNLAIILIVQFIILYKIFHIRRLKNGFDFLYNKFNNDYADIIVINICAVMILIYCLTGSVYDEITKSLFLAFIILGIAMFVIIQKTFVMYYKQNLMKREMEDYKRKIKEKDDEIKKLSNEKYEISRINHEFYNRQRALELKVKQMAEEAGEEIGILDRIEKLTKEYSSNLEKIKSKDKLPLTNIPEIDDMFSYMQEECNKNNIEFKLQIHGEIYKLVNNKIPTNKLETLIGDHIRNAIIATKFSENKNKSILVILGIKDKSYELCIYDSGIEFEKETLLKLGKERATTHKEAGGTGIGFMTTFETLKECKASLIIEEKHGISESDYTKAVKIRFDGKNQYKIKTYRAEELREMDKDKRIVVEDI